MSRFYLLLTRNFRYEAMANVAKINYCLHFMYWYCFINCIYCKKIVMKKNMGSADRIIRILLAVTVAILWYANVLSGTVAIVLLVLAGIFILTSFVGFCPLYALLGMNTCPRRSNQSRV
jgi:fatty acid desaturase